MLMKFILILIFALVANGATLKRARPTACDFVLPPLTFHTSLLDPINYPPLPLTSTDSRYAWTCLTSNDLSEIDCKNGSSSSNNICKLSPFKVDARTSVQVSSMLLLAADNYADPSTTSYGLNVDVIMSDASGAEWNIKSDALLSYSSRFYPSRVQALPELWLRFETHRCGCVERLLLSWNVTEGAGEESCEAPVTSLESCEHGACVPLWAFSKVHPTCEQRDNHLQSFNFQLPPSSACQPVRWHSIPPPKNALTTSFDGNCR